MTRASVTEQTKKTVHHRDGTTSTKWKLQKGGQVPADTTFKKFFDRQPDKWKRQYLGKGKFDLYKKGKLDLKDLSKNNQVIKLDTLKKKSIKPKVKTTIPKTVTPKVTTPKTVVPKTVAPTPPPEVLKKDLIKEWGEKTVGKKAFSKLVDADLAYLEKYELKEYQNLNNALVMTKGDLKTLKTSPKFKQKLIDMQEDLEWKYKNLPDNAPLKKSVNTDINNYKILEQESDTLQRWGIDNYGKKLQEGLTKPETDALRNYKATGYRDLNNALMVTKGNLKNLKITDLPDKFDPDAVEDIRYFSSIFKKRVLEMEKELKLALKKFKTPEDITVFRGLRLDDGLEKFFKENNIIKGKDFVNDTFISSSIRKQTAFNFANDHASTPGKVSDVSLMFEFKVPKGSKSIYMDAGAIGDRGEYEILLDSGSQFDVLDIVNKEYNGKMIKTIVAVLKNG